MKTIKKTAFSVLAIAILIACYYVYAINFNYRFTEISKDKVYRSAVIPPSKLESYVKKYNIKTVIDLRLAKSKDPLNPGLPKALQEEKEVIESIGGVSYVNIPSEQIPTQENLEQFYRVLDKDISYPVLIHCYHGTGRAVLYSALYRVEYEDFTTEEARMKTRFPVFLSSFDNGTPKGEWLKSYNPRKESSDRTGILATN